MIYGSSLYYLSTLVYADIFQNNLRRQKVNLRNIDKQEQRDKMIARREGHLKGFLEFSKVGEMKKYLYALGKVKQREKMWWCKREGGMAGAKSLNRQGGMRSSAKVEKWTGDPR